MKLKGFHITRKQFFVVLMLFFSFSFAENKARAQVMCSNLLPPELAIDETLNDLQSFITYAEIILLPKNKRDGLLARQIENRISRLQNSQLGDPRIEPLIIRAREVVALIRRQRPTLIPTPSLTILPEPSVEIAAAAVDTTQSSMGGIRPLSIVYAEAKALNAKRRKDQNLADELRAAAARELNPERLDTSAVEIFNLARAITPPKSRDEWTTQRPMGDKFYKVILGSHLPDGLRYVEVRISFHDLLKNGELTERLIGLSFIATIDPEDNRARVLTNVYSRFNSTSQSGPNRNRSWEINSRLNNVLEIHQNDLHAEIIRSVPNLRLMFYSDRINLSNKISDLVIKGQMRPEEKQKLREYLTEVLTRLVNGQY